MREHFESVATVPAPAAEVFAFLDDPAHLVAHMAKRTWSMAGGRMQLTLDGKQGRERGARIRLAGRVLGIALSLDEEVTEREPPRHKTWETVGTPRLLVVGPYRMGFDVTPEGGNSRLRVFIDYALPERPPARWLGRLFGRSYARWCTERMVAEALRHFSSTAPVSMARR